MEAIKRKVLPRRFSLKKGDTDYDNHEDADEETQEYVNKEIDEAEKQGHDTGRPGSFLNRLISHGNLKTEKQFQLEQQQQAEAAAAAGGQGKDVVIR